jgi:hypothetical protein
MLLAVTTVATNFVLSVHLDLANGNLAKLDVSYMVHYICVLS